MYRITGGDYDRAGSASSSLKEMLKKVGVEPAALRRAMIAAYEAETNVVIHACSGEMRVVLDEGVLDVEVVDEGPGIADVEQAMREGYSTAPPRARELGFGAGMGLPNIKRNSDRFQIESTVGRGTRVRFVVHLSPQGAAGRRSLSLQVVPGLCTGCLRCVRACPTGALRVRERIPLVLEHLCVECGACIAACEAGALAIRGVAEALPRGAGEPVVVQPALLGRLAPWLGPDAVLAALRDLGYGDVVVTAPWEDALREAVVQFARDEATAWPVLSPACPAVVSLVETRFPSLLGLLAPFVSFVEAVQGQAGRGAAVVVGCPAQCSVLATLRERPGVMVAPRSAVQAVVRRAAEGGKGGCPEAGHSGPEAGHSRFQIPDSRSGPEATGVLRVAGIRRVMAVLEEVENGQVGDVPALELFACDEGCFGTPLLLGAPAVARWRWAQVAERFGGTGRAVRRQAAPAPRRGLRLDEDMGRAIAKLAEMDRLVRELPGKDCGTCGAPTCRALAEDIVLGRATLAACVCRVRSEEETQ